MLPQQSWILDLHELWIGPLPVTVLLYTGRFGRYSLRIADLDAPDHRIIHDAV
jgi:hypothetical protein